MSETKCRRCLLKEAFPADYEKYVLSLLSRIPASARTGEGDYEARLSRCKACDQLANGTCMGCGCLVELKAAYKKETCPWKKW